MGILLIGLHTYNPPLSELTTINVSAHMPLPCSAVLKFPTASSTQRSIPQYLRSGIYKS